MRGLSLLDVLIIFVVLAVLLFAGSKEFAGYGNRSVAPAPAPMPAATPASQPAG
jgi:hypothetical protein